MWWILYIYLLKTCIINVKGLTCSCCELPCWFDVTCWTRSYGDRPEFLHRNSDLRVGFLWFFQVPRNYELWPSVRCSTFTRFMSMLKLCTPSSHNFTTTDRWSGSHCCHHESTGSWRRTWRACGFQWSAMASMRGNYYSPRWRIGT